MKTISLRTLIRQPLKVKQWTRTGKAVRVTDNGEPLWILQPTDAGPHEEERRCATEQILEDVLREKASLVSAVRLLEESRR